MPQIRRTALNFRAAVETTQSVKSCGSLRFKDGEPQPHGIDKFRRVVKFHGARSAEIIRRRRIFGARIANFVIRIHL